MSAKNKKHKKEAVRRNYKDTVFIDLFSSWESPISLYNAIFSSNLPKDTRVEFLQVANALYTSMKCDLAFMVGDELIVIIEHQSTINRNMPLRILLYIAKLYENILDENLRYARRLMNIPTPRFCVLYNGKDPYPERDELKLSDAYRLKGLNIPPQLDVIVPVININYGKNREIMERCPTLNGYSYIGDRIRMYEKYGEAKFDMAIEDCFKNNFLVDYLKKKRRRVKNMLQAEYSFEKELATRGAEERKLGILQGIKQGISQGLSQGLTQGITQGKIETARNCLDLRMPIETISQITGLSKEEIEKL